MHASSLRAHDQKTIQVPVAVTTDMEDFDCTVPKYCSMQVKNDSYIFIQQYPVGMLNKRKASYIIYIV